MKKIGHLWPIKAARERQKQKSTTLKPMPQWAGCCLQDITFVQLALEKKRFSEWTHPFNGTLVPRTIVEKIGLIKKEMFIWGDEEEYMARAKHAGYGTYTVTNALHFHPKEKGQKGNIIPFISKYTLLVKPSKMSHYFYRNKGFVYSTYPEKRADRTKYIMANVVYFVTHLKFGKLVKFVKYFKRGAKNIFD